MIRVAVLIVGLLSGCNGCDSAPSRPFAPPLDPSVATNLADATRFLWSGDHPVQTGVAPDTYAQQLAGTSLAEPLTLVETSINPALLSPEAFVTVDRGIQSVAVPNGLLSELASANIWNYIPIP